MLRRSLTAVAVTAVALVTSLPATAAPATPGSHATEPAAGQPRAPLPPTFNDPLFLIEVTPPTVEQGGYVDVTGTRYQRSDDGTLVPVPFGDGAIELEFRFPGGGEWEHAGGANYWFGGKTVATFHAGPRGTGEFRMVDHGDGAISVSAPITVLRPGKYRLAATKASTSRTTANSPVTLATRGERIWPDGSWRPVEAYGVEYNVQFQAPGRAWKTVASDMLTHDGTLSHTVTVKKTGAWRFQLDNATSKPVTVTVGATLPTTALRVTLPRTLTGDKGGTKTIPVTVKNTSGQRVTTRVGLVASGAQPEGTDYCAKERSPFRFLRMAKQTLPQATTRRAWCGKVGYRYGFKVDLAPGKSRTYRLSAALIDRLAGTSSDTWLSSVLLGTWWTGSRWVDSPWSMLYIR